MLGNFIKWRIFFKLCKNPNSSILFLIFLCNFSTLCDGAEIKEIILYKNNDNNPQNLTLIEKRIQNGRQIFKKSTNNNFDNLKEYFDHVENQKKNKTFGLFDNINQNDKIQKTTTKFPGHRRSTSRRPQHSSHRPQSRSTFMHTAAHTQTQTTEHTPKHTQRRTTRFPIRTTRAMTTAAEDDPADTASAINFSWIILCGFLIFTMQTGFGLLEGGIVSQKNETNIMLKNVADVTLGGFTYWIFGYGITYGTWAGSSPFFGIGFYAVDAAGIGEMGDLFTSFFFQLSFATTATTIVSGAVAERCNFKAYCLYSLFATITYSVQARWVWGPTGFLAEWGVIDIAGSGSVHLVGGTAAFIAAWMIGPRLGRYDGDSEAPPPGNNFNVLFGLFLLYFPWCAFNAGSTYGVTGEKWKFAARAAVSTMIASIGGGLVGILWGFIKPGKPFGVLDVVNAILGSLVAITAGCALLHTPEAFLTGIIGAIVVILAGYIPDKMHIDDPVGAMSVHGFGGMWGMLAVGFFADDDGGILGVSKGNLGLIRGGSGYLLGVQAIAIACIMAWTIVSTFIILFLINIVCPLRVAPHEELLGLDFSEHGVYRRKIGTSPAISLFGSLPEVQEHSKTSEVTGQDNPGHMKITGALLDVRRARHRTKRWKTSRDSSLEIRNKKIKSAVMFARAFKKIQARGNRINPRDRQYIFDEYKSPLKSSTESLNEVGVKDKDKKKKKNKNLDKKEQGNENRIFQWTRRENQKIEIKRDESQLNIQKEKVEKDKEEIEKINDKNKIQYIP